jgi:hypothetical protein
MGARLAARRERLRGTEVQKAMSILDWIFCIFAALFVIGALRVILDLWN